MKASEASRRADGAPDASTGPRQLDYLRRMGLALRATQGEPRLIKAIGVPGTDVYDKLLVLQELRPMFPDVVFFTLGLDARYSDDANLPWTRQLLIGGTMGLSLRAELQGDIPTFRDDYQATAFYSTLLALHRVSADKPAPAADAGLHWTSKAMLFEKPCDFDGQCPSISANRTARFTNAVTQGTASWLVILVPLLLWGLLRMALGNAAMWRRSRAMEPLASRSSAELMCMNSARPF